VIIIKIIGGLGNQMFQYAYAKALEENGFNVKIDISAFKTYKLHGGYQLDKYNIDLNSSTIEENNLFYRDNIFKKVLNKLGIKNSKIIKERNLLFDETLLKVEDNNYIDGYFQCEKYFINIKNVILEQFLLKTDLSDYAKVLKDKIINSKNSCSIHIRRGDFTNKTNSNIHGCCSLDYYNKSVEILNSKLDSVNYFIFSDDIKWVKENLNISNATYIDDETKRIPHEDIYLMSLCKNNIIANSSFSWWGAWLNKNESKIVIAPKRWFVHKELESFSKDIVCESWLKV
jgi:hypothetical protein